MTTAAPLGHLNPLLRQLAADPARARWPRLWRALSVEERQRGATHLLQRAPSPIDRRAMARVVAQARRMRESSAWSWPDDRLVGALARLEDLPSDIACNVIVALHVAERGEMLEFFLDRAGIPHTGPSIQDGAALDTAPPSPARLAAAASALRERYPAEQVLPYLLALRIMHPASLAPLVEWTSLQEWTAGASVVPAQAVADDLAASSLPPEATAAVPPGFTTLDRRLIKVVVDTAQGVIGALSEDELDDLIAEVIALNSERHASFYHAGFRDAVLHRPIQAELPAESEPRRRWYLAGFVGGLMRRGDVAGIVAAYDSQALLRKLASGGMQGDDVSWIIGPAWASGPYVFDALLASGREAEAGQFLNARTVLARGVPLFHRILDAASDLIRKGRAAVARPMIQLLEEVLVAADAADLDIPDELRFGVLRRQAHCHRQLGELARATDILERLAEERALSPTQRSHVLVDLGLIAAEYRGLSEIALPDARDPVGALAEQLERGRASFEEARNIEGADVGHARYCLGLLAMTAGQWRSAALNLDEAVGSFEARRDVYEMGGLLRRARMYLGLTLCLDLQPGAIRRAIDLVRESHLAGESVPRYLIDDLLAALDLASDEQARGLAEIMLAANPDLLDPIVRSDSGSRVPAVLDALMGRALDEQRGLTQRIQDAHSALPLLRRAGRVEDMATVLDVLEAGAMEDEECTRFIALLERPDEYEPAWSREEAAWARARCFEAVGDLISAGLELEQLGQRLISTGTTFAVAQAAEIVHDIRLLGLPEQHIESLQRRLAEHRLVAEQERLPLTMPVRILVVGGNETQARFGEELKRAIEAEYPVTVDFLYTGWSSNWTRYLDEVTRRLPELDGLVVMRYMRTTLGKRIRESLNGKPWCGCGGKGQGSLRLSILEAAALAQAARRQD